ncbi:MAG TPA: efflux RND transporter permease subunit [Acidimicrobiia bacterium]
MSRTPAPADAGAKKRKSPPSIIHAAIVRTSLKLRYIVVAAAAMMLVFGYFAIQNAQVDVFPEFAPPRVEIQTNALGLTSTEVEELVTVPLEQALQGTPGLDIIRSKSVSQLSAIELVFNRKTDLFHARQLVNERIAIATPSLPTWAAPPVMIQPLSATARVMKIGLSSKTLSKIQLSTIAYWKIRARLLGIPGVANVPIWGEDLQQLQVQTDPAKLLANNVTIEQVMTDTSDALDAGLLRFSESGFIGTGGFIDTKGQRLSVHDKLAIRTPQDLAAVPISGATKPDGSPLLLGDVATVKTDHQPRIGDAVIDGGPGLLLVVERLPFANTLDVTNAVENALKDMKPGLHGIQIDTHIFRPATFVELSIHNLTDALLIGSFLVVVVLVLFMFSWRSALISLVAIPLSLTGAALVLILSGYTINTMVLAGFVIACGAVVDDAIVDCENIVRRLRQHRREGGSESTAKVVLDASLEVRNSIVYASLIEALALLPVFFLTGLTGAFFTPLATSYALAIMVSMVVALTVTPAMCFIMLGRSPLPERDPPLVRWSRAAYGRSLKFLFGNPYPTYIAVATLIVAAAVVAPRLGQELFPNFKERDFLMHFISKPGTSQQEESRIVAKAAREIQKVPGVQGFGSHIGQSFLGEEITGVNFGEDWISISADADYDKTTGRIDKILEGYPGIFRNRETYLRERIGEVLTGTSNAISVRVFGDDLYKLRSLGQDVLDRIKKINGVTDANMELAFDVPQLDVEVDLAKADRYGIKPGDVRRQAATLVASEEVGDIFRGGRAYDVHVWTTPEARDSVKAIRALPIAAANRQMVRLDQVADVRLKPQPNEVSRWNASRTIDIGADVAGRDLGSVAKDINASVDSMKLPLGYHTEVTGEYVERQEQNSTMRFWGLIAAIAIFTLLYTSFKNMRLTLIAAFTLPMALVGGVVTAYFVGSGNLSMGSLVGFFTVLGIIARNGIMHINHFQHLEKYEGMEFGPELVLRGSTERVAPILMTALVAGMALVPLLLGGDVPGEEIEYPMAIVIIGGLFSATILNLFVVPVLYLRFGKSKAQLREIEAHRLAPEVA